MCNGECCRHQLDDTHLSVLPGTDVAAWLFAASDRSEAARAREQHQEQEREATETPQLTRSATLHQQFVRRYTSPVSGQSLSGICCRCVTRLWARDYGAAINIAHNLRYYLLHASWDPAFLSQHERAETASSGASTTGAQPPSHAHDHDGSHKRQRKC